jgi:hypothetical protein
MFTFVLVAALILCSGGAGGLASYLLQPPEKETRSFWGAVRFIVSGGIVALAVPLFLSLAQSSLIKGLFDTGAGDQRSQNALVLVGFCVVAGFAARKFMDSLAARMMHVEQVAQKAEEKSEKAKETSEEAFDLVEENMDRVAEATRSDGRDSSPRERPIVRPGPMNARAEELAGKLGPEEKAVLEATALYDTRTLTGISRDAGLPRQKVTELVPKMVETGVLHYTTSANTGGTRLQVTSTGVDILNNPVIYRYTSPADAVATPFTTPSDVAAGNEKTQSEGEVKSGD